MVSIIKEEEFIVNESEMNSTCCIMRIDMVLNQQQTLIQLTKTTNQPKFTIEMSSGGNNQSTSLSTSLYNEEEVNTNTNIAGSATVIAAASGAATTTTPSELKAKNNPDGGIWITTLQGVFYFKLNTLHMHL
ncbi:unnamed protein product [Rotaria sordida]|uniref:Uncharacterized protein n=1 Tax=Rotaria sordida TaxID=392033 RepID=A0A819AAD2_9BILA|nr:unnamed protein product [Rotaria sordida]CAF1309384.1 unnamed protein product [Rotaria sordida]CAF1347411.1 unnamed protein product [Rotaria sordida]CAF1579522.1 unnamed protein product [Rotaria sordida]CAF3781821.1 unnamed protein product [Rotaria sordida]